MATLQKIRTKAGLLVAIVIGISLAAFILGDMLQSGSSIFQKKQMEIGEIDNESIQYPEFQQQVEELSEIYRNNNQQAQVDENTLVQIREQTWQNIIRKILMGDVYEKLGIEVSADELFEMIQGTNLHPIVQQLFANPNTGQVDRNAIVSFLKNLETGVTVENRDYWLYLEKQIKEDRIQSKYNNMVAKGFYVTSEEAQRSLAEKNKQVSFDYITLNYNSIADSQVVVTEKDLKNYYDEHVEEYNLEKIRRIEYIVYPVVPSANDYKNGEDWIGDIKTDFETTTDNAQFVNSNSDVNFDGTWFKQEDLPENIGNWVFEEGADTNAVFGPYFENESYYLAKLNAIEMLPDSVEARHILLQVNTQEEVISMQLLADSLKTLIEGGSDFAALALQYSKDGSASAGGNLGWIVRGQMVQPFEDVVFANAKNEVSVTATEFGIHVVQTTDRSKLSKQVQVAYIVRNVVPSTRTYQDNYAIASKFAGENTSQEEFDAAVTEQKLNKRIATVGENDRQIVGLENARLLIRSAYDTDEGDVINSQEGTPIFELGDNFVIAVLTEATEEGVASFDDVEARVELSVLKEKKAVLLVEKANAALQGKTNIEDVATELDLEVQNVASITFNSFQIPGIGLEPAVIGNVTSLEVDQMSEAIAGNNGVFIVKITSVNQADDQNVTSEQFRLAQNLNYRAVQQAFEAHKNSVEITDQRSKFY